MWRVLREHVKGFERACGGLREKVLQSCKASTAENIKFTGKKIIAIKSDDILPYFEANLFLYQTLPGGLRGGSHHHHRGSLTTITTTTTMKSGSQAMKQSTVEHGAGDQPVGFGTTANILATVCTLTQQRITPFLVLAEGGGHVKPTSLQ